MQTVVVFLEQNLAFAVIVTFLAAASESLVVIGAFIPGTALILALGAAAGLGYLPLWPLVAAATIGAILGDGLSYWIGHAQRSRITAIWPFSSRPEILRIGEAYFTKYGWTGIAIARFLPGVRAIVPVVAGTSGMRPLPFYAANIGSAIVWAPAHLLPAAFAGFGLGFINQINPQTEIELFIGGLALVLGLWGVHKARGRISRFVMAKFQRMVRQGTNPTLAARIEDDARATRYPEDQQDGK
ncbi:MAG: DedA family protein [Alphaproteobacteria bacterium]|nr:DedA family protein [Alphaproteobacteria bacterium]